MGNLSHFLLKEKSIYAMDGSKFTLPASAELRAEFELNSGQLSKGKGHYPQALVMTITDVLRQLPIARKIVPCDRSERHEVMDLIEVVPENGVILGDRWFPSHEFFAFLSEKYQGHFVIRCPATSSFKEIGRMNKPDTPLTIKGLALRVITGMRSARWIWRIFTARPRKTYPRTSKTAVNKWREARAGVVQVA